MTNINQVNDVVLLNNTILRIMYVEHNNAIMLLLYKRMYLIIIHDVNINGNKISEENNKKHKSWRVEKDYYNLKWYQSCRII